jgi:hypothetical protein
MKNHVYLLREIDGKILYEGDDFTSFVRGEEYKYFNIERIGEKGCVTISFDDGKELIVYFDSFKVMMAMGLKQLHLIMN